METIVFGKEVGQQITRDLPQLIQPTLSDVKVNIEKAQALLESILQQKGTHTLITVRERLRRIMIDHFGVYRTKLQMKQGLAELDELESLYTKIELKDSEAQSAVFEAGIGPDNKPYKIGVIDLPSFYMDMAGLKRGNLNFKSTTRDVERILRDFNAGALRGVVTSKVLNEGVDMPAASVGIIMSGSASVREHVQRLGRILRRQEGKEAILYEVVSGDTGEEHVSDHRREHGAYR